MSTYKPVRQAIIDKKRTTRLYNGYFRKMTPHAIGTKKGVRSALFYQYGGESSAGLSSDPTKNWRCIPIEKIKTCLSKVAIS